MGHYFSPINCTMDYSKLIYNIPLSDPPWALSLPNFHGLERGITVNNSSIDLTPMTLRFEKEKNLMEYFTLINKDIKRENVSFVLFLVQPPCPPSTAL
jgi:hypothetical protein